MGYACPVCEERQIDAEHLANHLAFTAILRGGDHEIWLDQHAPGWDKMGPEALATDVAEHAETVEVEGYETEETEDPAHGAADHYYPREESPRGVGGPQGPRSGRSSGIGQDRLSADDRAVLEEARELTRQMLEGETAETGESGGEGSKSAEKATDDGAQGDSETE